MYYYTTIENQHCHAHMHRSMLIKFNCYTYFYCVYCRKPIPACTYAESLSPVMLYYIDLFQTWCWKTLYYIELICFRLGTTTESQHLRARMQSACLLSDMESFKAANPGCVLADFVRWYSPRDWIETEEMDDTGAMVTRGK